MTDVYCGHWISSHKRACDEYATRYTIKIEEKRDVVIASCGGYPFDINMIQAHKTPEAASHACKDGGTIVLIAECEDGLGRRDFLDWFNCCDSNELATRLCENYQVNGQTAWSLLKKAEKFNIELISGLLTEAVKKLRLKRVEKLAENDATSGYILPFEAKLQPVVGNYLPVTSNVRAIESV